MTNNAYLMKPRSTRKVIFTAVMWILGLVMIYPFIMMLAISFRVPGDAYKGLFASDVKLVLSNYQTVLGHKYFFSWFRNTIFTVVVTIALRLVVTLPAAYAFSRLKFRGRALIMTLLITTLMIPGETTMVPRYLFFKKIQLLNSVWAIILPETSEVFYLMMMTEFFAAIPKDYIEAAVIDGASHTRILTRIFVPLAIPSIATVILFSFIYIWNNFLDSFLFITSQEKQLMTPAVKYFMDEGGANIPKQLAFAVLALFPVIATFIFTQKFFIANVTSTGIKG